MIKSPALLIVALLVAPVFGAGCAMPLHYSWAYTPLHDARGEPFEPAGKPLYRAHDTLTDLVAAEEDLYREGYVMVGYVNMMSPQLSTLAKRNATGWGRKVGAARVEQSHGGGHYLATYWARPRAYTLGAFFDDDLPPAARSAIDAVGTPGTGVVVRQIVAGSPAAASGLVPGDLIVGANGEDVRDQADFAALLTANAGERINLLVWAETGPVPVSVTLARAR